MPQGWKVALLRPVAIAIVLVLMLGGLVAAGEALLRSPAVRVDLDHGPRLSPASGVMQLKEAFARALQPAAEWPDNEETARRLKEALESQMAYMQQASHSALLGNQAALESQLSAIRQQLDAEVARQMKLYRETLDTRAEGELRRAKADQAEQLQRFRRSLEAQYAATILNFRLRAQSGGLSERQALEHDLAQIENEIALQVAKREESDRRTLMELEASLQQKTESEMKNKRAELTAWAQEEYERIKAAQLAGLEKWNVDLTKAIRDGIRVRTNELDSTADAGR